MADEQNPDEGITRGDQVTLIFTDGYDSMLPEQVSASLDCMELVVRPFLGAGSNWVFRCQDGSWFEVNPSSSQFVGMFKDGGS